MENSSFPIYGESTVLTIGNKHGRAKVIVNELMTTGRKSKIFGYMSRGDKVPDVITTL